MSSWERKWLVNWDPKHVYRCGIPLELKLKRKAAKGIVFYDIDFKSHDSPDEWDDCWLVPRGTLPCNWHDAGAPLPPWDARHEDLYREGIIRQLQIVTATTNRLEGELDFGYLAKMVYFFQVHKAIRDPATRKFKDLLIVVTASNLPWNCPPEEFSLQAKLTAAVAADGEDDDLFGDIGDPIDDGTAHGNPK